MTHYGHSGPTSLHLDPHAIPYFEPSRYSTTNHTTMDYDYGHLAPNTSTYVPDNAFNPEMYYDLQIPFPPAMYPLEANSIPQPFVHQAVAMQLAAMQVPQTAPSTVSIFLIPQCVTHADYQKEPWYSDYASTYISPPLPSETTAISLPPLFESKHIRTASAQSLDKVLPPELFHGHIPSYVETESFLRHYLSQRRPKDMAVTVPDDQPLTLACLPDPTQGRSQPPYHLRTLTLLAIWSSPRKVLKLHEIVQSICYHFPFYTKDDKLKVRLSDSLILQRSKSLLGFYSPHAQLAIHFCICWQASRRRRKGRILGYRYSWGEPYKTRTKEREFTMLIPLVRFHCIPMYVASNRHSCISIR